MGLFLEGVEKNTKSQIQIHWSFKENPVKELTINVTLVTSLFVGIFVLVLFFLFFFFTFSFRFF